MFYRTIVKYYSRMVNTEPRDNMLQLHDMVAAAAIISSMIYIVTPQSLDHSNMYCKSRP